MPKLMRTWYDTDATDANPAYAGTFSNEIPKPGPEGNGYTIVGVDWSTRGVVEVTYLIP